MKRLTVQRRAMRDLADARDYYRLEAPHMVSRFALAVDAAFSYLQRHGATGSPRYGLQLGIPQLRSWPVRRFPYVVFYRDLEQRVVVLRVLHQASDIPKHIEP